MIALTTPCPRNRSRTRIHATIVPITALIRQTATETKRVSLSAATACGSVIASQKPPRPALPACHISAASGRMTIRLRYAVASPIAIPGPGVADRGGPGQCVRASAQPPCLRWIFVTIPFRGSKNSLSTFAQPPRYLIVNWSFGTAKPNDFAALRSTGR